MGKTKRLRRQLTSRRDRNDRLEIVAPPSDKPTEITVRITNPSRAEIEIAAPEDVSITQQKE